MLNFIKKQIYDIKDGGLKIFIFKLNVFIINKMAGDVSIAETFKGVLPFLFSDIVRVILLFSFPGITLFLLKVF